MINTGKQILLAAALVSALALLGAVTPANAAES